MSKRKACKGCERRKPAPKKPAGASRKQTPKKSAAAGRKPAPKKPAPAQVTRSALWFPDFSHHNGDIKWAVVAQQRAKGMRGCFLKATEGGDWRDLTFADHWVNSRRSGFLRGAYHYFLRRVDAEVQVDNFVNALKEANRREIGAATIPIDGIGPWVPGDLPPVLDVEKGGPRNEKNQWKGVSKKDAADMVVKFLELLKTEHKLSVNPIIYLSVSFYQEVLGGDQRLIDNVNWWFADYTSPFPDRPRVPAGVSGWDWWQYTPHGELDGVQNEVDFSNFNGGETKLQSLLIR